AALVDVTDQIARETHAQTLDEARVPGLVRHLLALGPEPADILDVGAADRAALKELAPLEDGLLLPDTDRCADEVEEALRSLVELPVEPAELVVLAIRVVVPLLRVAELVAGQQHRHALREQHRGDQVPLLALAQADDFGIVRRALDAAVPRVVLVDPVSVLLAVCL